MEFLVQTLVVATHNPGKLVELQTLLQELTWNLALMPPNLEIAETGKTFAANARLKAAQVAQATGQWAIADDSGLEVMALGGAPGVYSARYAKTDPARIGRLLQELAGHSDRQAQFVCAIAVAQPDGGIALESEGTCQGEILTAPRGEGGFGYDPVFYVPAAGMTYAEMPAALKRQWSHRGKAFEALLPRFRHLPS
jgi:XTP/dITP diphosphohydrolase